MPLEEKSMQKPIFAAISILALGTYLIASPPARADLPPERELLGVRMWRPASSVFAKFGAPSRQISSYSSPSATTMGGMPGMMGSSAGYNPYSMMGSGGYPGGTGGAKGAGGIASALNGTGSILDTPEEVLHALVLLSQNKNVSPIQTIGGGGMPGFMPGSPMTSMGMTGASPYGGSGPSSPYSGMGASPYSGMGASPYGGSGPSSPYSGMGASPYSGMGASPYGGSGPSTPYSGMGASPYSGMGGPGGMPGMMGGMGGQQVSDLTPGQTRWFYDGSPEKVFTFNKDGRVIEIGVFAKTGIVAGVDVKKDELLLMKIALTGKMSDTMTSRHISLGSTMAAVYKSYGWPAHVLTSGDVVLLDYRDTAHVAFKCDYFGKKVGYRVTGIVVSLSE
jgi:hypothetical protein